MTSTTSDATPEALAASGERLALGLLLACGLVVRLALAWAPVSFLVRTCTADDFFYYLTIARNAAAGLDASADGTVPTNGFHPLWAIVLRAVVAVGWDDPDTSVGVALTILSVSSVVAAVPLYAVLRRTGARLAAFVAVGWWLFEPRAIALTLAGVEAPLACAALAWATWVWLRASRAERGDGEAARPGARHVAVVGALLGIAMLARTDSVLYALVLGVDMLRVLTRGSNRPDGLLALARGVAAAALVVSPWVAWNLVRFGGLRQDSERAISLRSEALAAINHDAALGAGLHRLSGWAGELFDSFGLGAPGAIGLAGVLLLALASAARAGRRRHIDLVGLAVLAMLVPALFYAFVLRFRQAWYMTTSAWILALLAGLSIEELGGRAASLAGSAGARARAGAVGIAVAGAALGFARHASGYLEIGAYPWQSTVRTIVMNVHAQAPRELRFGAFNSGIVSYYAPGRVVVNLDGVVNRTAIDALARKELLAYMRRREIGLVIDTERYVRMYSVFAEPSYATAFHVMHEQVEPSSGTTVLVLALPLERAPQQRPHPAPQPAR